MSITYAGESAQYRAAREALLESEVRLRRLTEDVAVQRRALPPGPVVEDYVFQRAGADGEPTDVRMSELFEPGKDSLVIYNYMFPRHPADERPGPDGGETAELPLDQGPCPSCTGLLDQLDGMARHSEQRVNFVVSAKAPIARVETFARERGWRHLRFVSSAHNTYARDTYGESDGGSQLPMTTVFHREGDEIRLFWGAELFHAPTEPGQDPRQVGGLEPLWNLLDLIPEGRGEWDEQLSYDCCDVTPARPSPAPAG
jgi:predicted dithiol-disulfide oxidoreductase (DUF899 family)